MRVLFLSEYYPFDLRLDVSGVFQRMRMLLDAAKTLGELDILFFAPEEVDTSPTGSRRLEAALEAHWNLRATIFFRQFRPGSRRSLLSRIPFWARCIASGAVAYQSAGLTLDNSHQPSVDAVAHCLDRKPDLIVAFRLGTMAPLLRMERSLPPVFFDLDDGEHVKALRTASHAPDVRRRAVALASAPILLWSELRAMRLARSTFVCSDFDLHRFRHFPRHAARAVIPNAIGVPAVPLPSDEVTVLFIGNYVYGPNVDAADVLVREVWPLVHRRLPKARLLIAGSYTDRIPSLAHPPDGVEILGFVDDLAALYQRTRVVCCPIRVAGGTRIKILEAASFGKAIVSTTVGAEGLTLQNNEEILLRDDRAALAEACIELLGDAERSTRMGTAARAAVIRLYDRDTTIARIREVISAALRNGKDA